MASPGGLLLTDLDGTLLDAQGCIPARVRQALSRLAQRGVVRAVATGRSLLAVRRVLQADDPVDYVIFSSGAGAMRWPDGEPLLSRSMSADACRRAAAYFYEQRVDFLIHEALPESHRFSYRIFGTDSQMWSRIERYPGSCQALSGDDHASWERPASQLVGMPLTDDHAATHAQAVAALPDHAVVRTTSPNDHQSLWLEVFPKDVSKASAGAWLAQNLDVEHCNTLVVGNDWNDLPMLEWAANACVVANAAEELRERFDTVPSNGEGGLCEALQRMGWA